MFAEGSVYTPPGDDDGLRVLVMRRWPRGVPQERVDVWLKELGPLPALLDGLETRRLSWLQFEAAYRSQIETRAESREAFALVRELEQRSGKVTLLCHERRPPCHRFILLAMLS